MPEAALDEEGKTASGIFYQRTRCKLKSEQNTNSKVQTIVLVMGYGASLRIWPQSMVQKLAQDFDVIIYDNRGTGLSFLPENISDYSIALMARDLEDLVQTLKVDQFHLLGYSMGGCIALQYASMFPDRVRTLFLLSTTAGGKLFTPSAPELIYGLMHPQGKNLWEIYLYTFSLMYSKAGFQKAAPTLRAIWERSKSCPTRPAALAGHGAAFKAFDGSTYLTQLKMPVTILTGEADRMVPSQNSLDMAALIPQARLVVVPECEHCVHGEEEDLVIDEIKKLTEKAYDSQK